MSIVRKAILPLFFISGATGLIFGITCTRLFNLTPFPSYIVLTAFILGLALGSRLFGQIADRIALPLKLFAFIELAIGLYIFALPTILSLTEEISRWFYQNVHPGFYTLSFFQFVLSFFILLFPTTLLGGMLPILSRLRIDRFGDIPRVGRNVGLLYAINTFGMVAGAFLSGYVLFRFLGVSHTIYLAAAVSILLGLFTLGLSHYSVESLERKNQQYSRRPRSNKSLEQPDSIRWLALIAMGLTGFCAFALGILWMKILGTNAHALTCTIACFAFGIAFGSLICSRLPLWKIKKPVLTISIVEFLIGFYVLLTIFLSGRLGSIHSFGQNNWPDTMHYIFDSSIILMLPAFLIGATFPIILEIYTRSTQEIGKRVGEVFACQCLGGAIALLTIGFIIIPIWGLKWSFITILAIQCSIAAMFFYFSEARRKAIDVLVICTSNAVFFVGVWSIPKTFLRPGTIVNQNDDGMMLRKTQQFQALAPLLVHGNPSNILQIGGNEVMAEIGLAFGVDQYNVTKIYTDILGACPFSYDSNEDSYHESRLRKIKMDGKSFIKLTDEKFDIIINGSSLYTTDHFIQCRKRLNDEGVLTCLISLDLHPEDFAMTVRSFQTAMPYSSLWMVNNNLNKYAVLMGTLLPTQIDFQRAQELIEKSDIALALKQINLHSIYEFLDCFMVDQEGLRNIGGDGPLNTEDRPFLNRVTSVKHNTHEYWLDAYSHIIQNHCPVFQSVVNMIRAEYEVQLTMGRYDQGTHHALRGLLAMLQDEPEVMHYEFELALKVNPNNRTVPNCLDELVRETIALAEAVEKKPDQAPLRLQLAKRYRLQRDDARAVEQYDSFLKLEPHHTEAWNHLGLCHALLGQFDKAIQAFEKAIENDPQYVSAYINLAEVHEKRGNWDAASNTLEKTVSIYPNAERVRIYDTLARSYFIQKKYDLALEILEKALEFVSNDTQQYDYLESRKEFVKRAAQETREND